MCPHGGGVALGRAGGNGRHVIDDGGKVGGPGEFQLGQNHPVGFNDPLDA